MTVIVDGGRGEVILDPDDAALAALRGPRRARRRRAGAAAGRRRATQPAVTLDGAARPPGGQRRADRGGARARSSSGAESIGLFRTEFLYLERPDLPTEEEHYAHAVAALKAVGAGRIVTFRTLDLGGDKLPASVRMPAGHNPALGLRSIRYSLWRKDLFKAQLRALYRAAAVAPAAHPVPADLGRGRAARGQGDLRRGLPASWPRRGVEHNAFVPLGVMIETPSAAAIADLLGNECEFLTIGTNDLIQYALAADRQDEHVGYLYHPLHPAILRLAAPGGAGAPSGRASRWRCAGTWPAIRC